MLIRCRCMAVLIGCVGCPSNSNEYDVRIFVSSEPMKIRINERIVFVFTINEVFVKAL